MKKINLIFGTHNNQPFGTHDHIFEEAYQKAYKPFLSVLNRVPEINTVLHYSGALLEWIEGNHPEFLMLLNDLIKRKQVELLGGGFYEPIMPILPTTDRIGQIETMTTYLRKRFGKRPRGIWIAERVWEQSLTYNLKTCGMDYTFLDDQHYLASGLRDEMMFQPVITEDQGKAIVVFPISHPLRYMVPFNSPEDIIQYLGNLDYGNKELTVVILGDGEKFGFWEGTYKRCYEEKWLERFLALLKENNEWIETTLPARYVKRREEYQRRYFPSASYEEMMEWSLEPVQQEDLRQAKTDFTINPEKRVFLRGGDFRNFLTRYRESNRMYCKMIYTNLLVNQLRGDKSRKKAAREELWKGQSHAAYWHGRFGGIYVNYLRKVVYSALIEAEKITREKGVFIPSIIATDYDMDGKKEYLFQGQDINGYITQKGGQLFELDCIPVSWNYLDTMTRYRESYHNGVIHSQGYDIQERLAFTDHFIAKSTSLEDYKNNLFAELSDFTNSSYLVEDFNREHSEVTFSVLGTLQSENSSTCAVKLTKKYIFKKQSLAVYYTIENAGEQELSCQFVSEINLSFASNAVESLRMFFLEGKKRHALPFESTEKKAIKSVLFEDRVNDVTIEVNSSNEYNLWLFPIETVSQSLSGFDTYYQSTCAAAKYDIQISPGGSWETRLSIEFIDL
ncbi:MAG: alpha-amylase/4-alpha-glucanotransferase domain-containing protein [Spirochaetia bacterium]